jgi:hypothetical protein
MIQSRPPAWHSPERRRTDVHGVVLAALGDVAEAERLTAEVHIRRAEQF